MRPGAYSVSTIFVHYTLTDRRLRVVAWHDTWHSNRSECVQRAGGWETFGLQVVGLEFFAGLRVPQTLQYRGVRVSPTAVMRDAGACVLWQGGGGRCLPSGRYRGTGGRCADNVAGPPVALVGNCVGNIAVSCAPSSVGRVSKSGYYEYGSTVGCV